MFLGCRTLPEPFNISLIYIYIKEVPAILQLWRKHQPHSLLHASGTQC